MKTCKECLYFEVCAFRYETLCKGIRVEDLIHDCTKFKDRSKYIEVVRCKDCKWRNTKGCWYHAPGRCAKREDNDFCSDGERKEDGNKA